MNSNSDDEIQYSVVSVDPHLHRRHLRLILGVGALAICAFLGYFALITFQPTLEVRMRRFANLPPDWEILDVHQTGEQTGTVRFRPTLGSKTDDTLDIAMDSNASTGMRKTITDKGKLVGLASRTDTRTVKVMYRPESRDYLLTIEP